MTVFRLAPERARRSDCIPEGALAGAGAPHARRGLCGQDQIPMRSDAQAILAAVVLDDELPQVTQERRAAHPSALRREGDGPPIFPLGLLPFCGHEGMIMILDIVSSLSVD
jgi:hypothetical protein